MISFTKNDKSCVDFFPVSLSFVAQCFFYRLSLFVCVLFCTLLFIVAYFLCALFSSLDEFIPLCSGLSIHFRIELFAHLAEKSFI